MEFGGGSGGDESKDLFEDSLEDALCVFKSGGAGGKDADILKENEQQILFYVDLENEAIIDKNGSGTSDANGGTGEDDLEDEVQGSKHPILLN